MPTPTSSPTQAKKLLQNVKPDWKAFWFSHGVIAHNLAELSDALKKIDTKIFSFHVNKEKNDLWNWANAVIGDKTLAKRLKGAKTLKTAQKIVSERVAELSEEKAKKIKKSRTRPKT